MNRTHEIEADGFVTLHVWPPPRRLEPASAAWIPPGSRILLMVSRRSGYSMPRLCGQERSMDVLRARDAAIWLARECTGYMQSEIARCIGDRDPSTICTALRRAERRRETDPGFKHWTDVMAAEFAAGSGERAG